MKTITKTYNLYQYNELSDKAKEKVNEWYIDDPIRNEFFHEDIIKFLKAEFPFSELCVEYSLGCCQGDGLNIYGKFYLPDFIDKWKASEKEKKAMKFYFEFAFYNYTFETNNHYCYSCKFIDKKYIDDTIQEFIQELESQYIKNIKTEVIIKFFNDFIDYFEVLDDEFERDGYKYFYEPDEDEIKEACEANDWYFDIDGNFAS